MLKQLGKKGIGMLLYNAISVFLIFLILVFFFFLTYFMGSVKQDISSMEEIEINTILLNYLRTPVTIEGQEVLISDLIRMYIKNQEKYRTPLEDKSKQIFDKIFEQYKLSIDNKLISQGKVAMTEDWESSGTVLQEMNPISTKEPKLASSEFNLPGFDKEIKIKLVVE